MNTKIIYIILLSIVFLSCQPKEENHIHTLAFNPVEPEALYVGTHHYLEKHKEGKITKIGSYDEDYMGFVITADGTFYSSGHSSKVPNVGIRKSTNQGKSWQTLRYEGLDFHDMAITYSNPQVIYAWSTPPEELLVISKDGGQSWEEIETDFRQDLYTLAADHQQESKLYAGTLLGLFVSQDYGKTWSEELKNTTVLAITDDPMMEGTTYISTYSRGILRTTDEGDSWEALNQGLPPSEQNPLLFLAANPSTKEVVGFTRNSELYRYNGEEWNKIEVIYK